MVRILTLAMLLTLSGCCIVEVEPDIPCPPRPELMPIPEDLQIRMGPDAVWIVGSNQLAMKKYAKELEVRAGCEDR